MTALERIREIQKGNALLKENHIDNTVVLHRSQYEFLLKAIAVMRSVAIIRGPSEWVDEEFENRMKQLKDV